MKNKHHTVLYVTAFLSLSIIHCLMTVLKKAETWCKIEQIITNIVLIASLISLSSFVHLRGCSL